MTDSRARRRFTLADAMVLVAATALGFLPTRRLVDHVRFDFTEGILSLHNFLTAIAFPAVLVATPCAVSWTMVLLPLRFLPPRPDRRRLVRQRGFVATVMFGVIGGAILLEVGVISATSPGRALSVAVFLTPFNVGPGIAAGWLTLAMLSRRRPPADWIDRLGRALGWFWILAALIQFYNQAPPW